MFTIFQEGFRRWVRPGAAAGLVLFLSTCGGDGSPTDPNGNFNGQETGSIQVTAATTNNPDPNGFDLTVDGGTAVAIEVNGSVTIPDVPTGNRTVSLAGIGPNCAVEGQSAQPVTVSRYH